MSRKSARKHTYKLVFQLGFFDSSAFESLPEIYLDRYENFDPIDAEFVNEEYFGIVEHLEHIDNIIEKYTKGWTISRLNKTDLAALRLGVYEMIYVPNMTVPIVANEIVQLAKIFGTEDSPGYVNGVLAQIGKEIESGMINAE